ncbi:bifunctional diaminohydroxyphosphoribosylaminopyrimidine deaminase/5-amino-6-(5-phosphoribosylamino)uracil reductase RibD [Calidifontibacter sp. DB0510]|uniref:Riboflavin biosynthesis protein RibD n=1 Tax=Metallococcus carri TaxID=1656884 RepID=A0A967AXU7_9MICO|nr:bifunctional diaminohydroxyphosphoribosylaminopyrimidine deaminase/5-amino-6-(5-phosphoribosylamino)uracil reductase RibD [Metallococcus carri]NHN54996.1 bifunctional diaminohydroxyphosphoribosylaminopyrimidine deaminase/5-amino-6-(5-phosphoribosylamino)uracil reductase RibD [Metallococcus carri]NOP37342.1 bifunctional diaminohydroxyphosphoribosylaminopyrimidine deaminase/5-amino-6-(5-phosphoribosylamino)uracil reductase RibD [Calidifontibacter sp. DB2511S]
MTSAQQDQQWMRAALTLAARGPVADVNPRVGCVIVRDGELAGEGFHQGAGTDHAEVAALRAAGTTRGATAYVTLEPCAHTGRTGPCTEALLAAGIARVVIGATDPNPIAAGGADRLRAAGVRVDEGVLAAECTELNRTWTYAVRVGRPFVTWKLAATLDGRVAARDGSSRWITGAGARAEVHELRHRVGAIAVGTATVVADDPALTARPASGPSDRQPLRVVVGNREIDSAAKVFDDSSETLQVSSHDPSVVLTHLHERGIHHLLLEGGPTLAAAFVRADCVDEIVAYVAPVLLGAGPAVVGDLGIDTIDAASRWQLTSVSQVGDDARLTLRRKENP